MDKELLRKIAKRIKKLRKSKNYTQDDLSALSNIARSTIGNLETAQNDIVLSKLKKITDALEITLSEFFDFEENENSK